jgi:hypothetical protein
MLRAMAAVTVELPAMPTSGAAIDLHGVAWPEDSFEVQAFLNVGRADPAALDERDPHFVGRFFLYGSGAPRPAHADGIGLDVRFRVGGAGLAFAGAQNILTLVARDAAGRPLEPADLRIGAASVLP